MAHNHAHAAHHDHKADARAAFMGLIFGAIALLVMVIVIVMLTNKKFDAHAPTTPAHEATTPATGAPPATPAAQPTKTPH